jgi:uncharacterized protein YoxC
MEQLDRLERNIQALLAKQDAIMEENRLLTDDNRRQHEEIMQCHARIVSLQHELRDVRTAASMIGSEASREKARLYLTQIINQVDSALNILTQ